ncbi:MAG: DMT family transporter [Alphaproteobacteria bacterium]|nr:DMT family transporter [Alphaproteobacteria bacterium]
MSTQQPSPATSRVTDLWPGIAAAVSFGVGDVYSKIVLLDGGDVLTLSLFRGLFSGVVIYAWLRLIPPPVPMTAHQRNMALLIGVLFAGVVYGLFKAIELTQVPVAVLSYFVYPLFTGIAGAILGIDKVTWRGMTAAAVAFLGLALIVGAQPGPLALGGIAFAVGAAACRTGTLLMTRALLQGVDARLITWYSLVSSTAIFGAIALATWHWQGPQTGYGWFAMILVGALATIAVLTLFMSTHRIGPFRTALIMNLEPLLATVLAAPLLGEVVTPLQALGGAIMLGALVAFQLRR